MHFSRPSGQRLSWCRPWKRGAVGSFSNGYCSVTTFLNMVRNVTPKPATGSQNCSLSEGESAIGVPSVGLRIVGGLVGRGGRGGHRGLRRAHGGAGVEPQRLRRTAYGAT